MICPQQQLININEQPIWSLCINSLKIILWIKAIETGCGLEGLRVKENKEVYEGEVTELTPEYTQAEVF